MEKSFSARTCPIAELAEISTFEDLGKGKRVYICSNALCIVMESCNTVCEKTLDGLQYPLSPNL